MMKVETTDGGSANEVLNVWFSQFMNELCNFILINKLIIPMWLLIHNSISETEYEKRKQWWGFLWSKLITSWYFHKVLPLVVDMWLFKWLGSFWYDKVLKLNEKKSELFGFKLFSTGFWICDLKKTLVNQLTETNKGIYRDNSLFMNVLYQNLTNVFY